MFQSADTLKTHHASVYGGDELRVQGSDALSQSRRELPNALKLAVQKTLLGEATKRAREREEAEEGDDAPGSPVKQVELTGPAKLLAVAGLTETDDRVEAVTRGMSFLVKGQGYQDDNQASALIDATRVELLKQMKRKAIQTNGMMATLFSRLNSTLQHTSSDPLLPVASPAESLAMRQDRLWREGLEQKRNADWETVFAHFVTRWRYAGKLGIFLVQMYIVFTLFFRLGFEQPVSRDEFILEKFIIDLPMLLKIILNFVARVDESSGVTKLDVASSAKEYLKFAFWVDLAGIFPLDGIGAGIGSRCTILTGNCGFVAPQWAANRILQCRGMFEDFGDVVEIMMLELSLHPSLGRLVQLTFIFLTSVHFVACTAFFLLLRDAANFENWFENAALQHASVTFQYTVAFDWAAKNLVGMSRGSAFPPDEVAMVFVVFVTFFGVTIYGLLMANLSMFYERVTPQSNLLSTIDMVIDTQAYMGRDLMHDDFAEQIIEYYTHVMKARHHLTEADEIFDNLPEVLDDELTNVVGRELIEQIPVLAGQVDNAPFVLLFARTLVPIVLLPNSVVFRKDDFGNCMYFIVNGVVKVLDPLDETNILATLGAGQMIGEIAILTDLPRTASVVTSDRFVDCLSLDRNSFTQMLDQFPDAMSDVQSKVQARAAQLQRRRHEKDMADTMAAIDAGVVSMGDRIGINPLVVAARAAASDGEGFAGESHELDDVSDDDGGGARIVPGRHTSSGESQ